MQKGFLSELMLDGTQLDNNSVSMDIRNFTNTKLVQATMALRCRSQP
jgi:hypothetical protein